MAKFITLEYIQIEFQSYWLCYVFKRFNYKSERSHKFPDFASVVSQETISLWKQSYYEHTVLDSYYDYHTSKTQSWIYIH